MEINDEGRQRIGSSNLLMKTKTTESQGQGKLVNRRGDTVIVLGCVNLFIFHGLLHHYAFDTL